jgi:hypothetical protein
MNSHASYIHIIVDVANGLIALNVERLEDDYVKNCNEIISNINKLITNDSVSFNNLSFISEAFKNGIINDNDVNAVKRRIADCFNALLIMNENKGQFDIDFYIILDVLFERIKSSKGVVNNIDDVFPDDPQKKYINLVADDVGCKIKKLT